MQQTNYKWVMFIALVLLLLGVSYLLHDARVKIDNVVHTVDKITRDRKSTMDSLVVLASVNDSLNQSIAIYKDSLEALSKYKSKVIIKYRDQKKFVNDADINQLDSIIRANIGAKP
jgi:hypothetical protein